MFYRRFRGLLLLAALVLGASPPESDEGLSSLFCTRIAASLRHAPQCAGGGVATVALHPLLVVGSGGAGTHATTRDLVLAGVQVGHEILSGEGMVSWPHAFNQ
jgi:hypothetical protein